MRTVAFIPVRGGSRSIPLKNIRRIGGRPLVHWTLDAALGCPDIERVFVSTDSPRIAEVAREIADPRLEVIGRSPATATDTASTESALLEFAESHDFERVVLVQATSPLLTSGDLDGALGRLDESRADSLLSVTREHRFVWRPAGDGGVAAHNYEPSKRPRRQDWEGELLENGAFYITGRDALLKSGCRLSGRIVAWEMAPETALELDEPADWARLEPLLRARADATLLAPRAQKIQLLVTDVDGVLTDAGMYYGPGGDALKKFNTRDGMGLQRWRRAGGRVAIITGENSPMVAQRARKLQVEHVYLGESDKAGRLRSILEELGLEPSEVAYIGDDLNDAEVMQMVGIAACPADAEPEIQALSHLRCERGGGEGCVRELVERLLALRH